MVRQQHAVLQTARGIPPGFWLDPLVLGYYSALISMVAKFCGSDAVSASDRGLILQDSLSAISNLDSAKLAGLVFELTANGDPDFVDGKERGQIVAMAFSGVLTQVEMMKVLENIGTRSTASLTQMRQEAPALIQRSLFFDEVSRRFCQTNQSTSRSRSDPTDPPF